MSFLVGITIIINIAVIAVFLPALLYTFETPKSKALYGYVVAGATILYLAALSVLMIVEIFNKHFVMLFLILFILSPFIIGKLVKYQTLKKYTLVQIFSFALSLVVLVLKYFVL